MNLNVAHHHLARVMFPSQILHRQAVGRVQTTEFQNYKQVMFRPIITTNKKYIERQYTIFITLFDIFPCLLRRRQMHYDTTSVSWRKACLQLILNKLRHKSFVIIPISSLAETHVYRLTSIKSGFGYNAFNRISSLVSPNVSSSYSAHIRNKHKRIYNSCFSRFNSSFSPIFIIVTLHGVRIKTNFITWAESLSNRIHGRDRLQFEHSDTIHNSLYEYRFRDTETDT